MTFVSSKISTIWHAPGHFWLWVEYDTGRGTYSSGNQYPSRELAEQAAYDAEHKAH